MLRYLLSTTAACLLSSSASASLKPRDAAPDFQQVNAVVGTEFTKVSLSEYRGKYLIMLFYPFDFTYVCPTELIAFSEAMAEFRSIGAEVLGVSTDSHFTHLAWIKAARTEGGLGKIEYPLLADISKDLSRQFGVLVENPKDSMYGAALRGLFLIDPQGTVRSVQINDDAVGRSVDEAIRLVKAFQFADKHGEVCPANWQPGDKTIVPNQVDKLDFFQTKYTESKDKEVKSEPIDPNAFRVEITKEGDGKSVPNGSQITVHYTGYLVDGSVFDSSVSRNKPFTFKLGQQQVIKCWDLGFKQLSVGAKATLTCPADFAYGDRGFASLIPPKATLTFEVEVISYK